MRSFENGTLKMEGSQEKGMPPLNSMRVPMENAPAPHLLTQLNPERMYLLGDPRYLWQENINCHIWCHLWVPHFVRFRTNQNPAFLVMGILFYRWHNYQVLKHDCRLVQSLGNHKHRVFGTWPPMWSVYPVSRGLEATRSEMFKCFPFLSPLWEKSQKISGFSMVWGVALHCSHRGAAGVKARKLIAIAHKGFYQSFPGRPEHPIQIFREEFTEALRAKHWRWLLDIGHAL